MLEREKTMLLSEDRKALLNSIGVDTWKEQEEILDHPARIKLVAGGERAGKSFLGALSIISKLDEFQPNDVVWWQETTSVPVLSGIT